MLKIYEMKQYSLAYKRKGKEEENTRGQKKKKTEKMFFSSIVHHFYHHFLPAYTSNQSVSIKEYAPWIIFYSKIFHFKKDLKFKFL